MIPVISATPADIGRSISTLEPVADLAFEDASPSRQRIRPCGSGRSWCVDVTTPFVSFAQNFEDVMLWRALAGVHDGFYIDVGAYLPVVDSVTEAFYQRGWRGINVEPHPEFHAALEAARPRDINLKVALGLGSEMALMTFVPGTGLSTLDESQGSIRMDEGVGAHQVEVQVETLSNVWAKHVPVGQDVHYMKVDVEGAEREVLLGNDWQLNRPWIVVVEAVDPTTKRPSFGDWERILIEAGYSVVYRDGLNRFYLADEHRELRAAFDFPPNVFDQFVRVGEGAAAVAAATRTAIAADERARQANEALDAIKRSNSWRLTRPLRAAADWFRKFARRSENGPAT